MPRSSSIDLMYRLFLPASQTAMTMNSASVELSATTSWNYVLYRIEPPANVAKIPVTDLRCVASPPYDESTWNLTVGAAGVFLLLSGIYLL